MAENPTVLPAAAFRSDCRNCKRITDHLDRVRQAHPAYHCAPVAPFGPADARLLIVGLAPGEHGANATGRPFTGDYAGILLYQTLHEFGFSSAPRSVESDDGLELLDCRITNAVKCLPPQNKPTTAEIRDCNAFLAAEIESSAPELILALGRIAHEAVLRARGERLSRHPFAHGQLHEPETGPRILDCYHCSRYNTNTGRLTPEMFRSVFVRARELLA